MGYTNFISSVFWIILVTLLIISAIGAYLMSKSAADKGYGSEAHIMAICFWLGIYGYLYTISLPDKKLQKQNESLSNELKSHSINSISDELPDL